jgi:inward rectifier potassium channel
MVAEVKRELLVGPGRLRRLEGRRQRRPPLGQQPPPQLRRRQLRLAGRDEPDPDRLAGLLGAGLHRAKTRLVPQRRVSDLGDLGERRVVERAPAALLRGGLLGPDLLPRRLARGVAVRRRHLPRRDGLRARLGPRQLDHARLAPEGPRPGQLRIRIAPPRHHQLQLPRGHPPGQLIGGKSDLALGGRDGAAAGGVLGADGVPGADEGLELRRVGDPHLAPDRLAIEPQGDHEGIPLVARLHRERGRTRGLGRGRRGGLGRGRRGGGRRRAAREQDKRGSGEGPLHRGMMPAVLAGYHARLMSDRPSIRLPDPQTQRFSVRALGQERTLFDDLYHHFLSRSWAYFFSVVGVIYVLTNALFASVYSVLPGSIANARSGSFEDAFFFSVQTMATIGYGGMAPATRTANLLVTVEAIVAMLGTALVTGITFAKFARPTARVLFAEKIAVTPRDGVPHLMFRMANWRHNQILEAGVRAQILISERTREGEVMRRAIDLPLVRDRTSFFWLTFVAMHRIDEKSPFFEEGAIERLRGQSAQIFLSVTGHDETLAQTVHARQLYELDSIVRNARFADVISTEKDGTRVIDYTLFHEIVPLDSPGLIPAPLPPPL